MGRLDLRGAAGRLFAVGAAASRGRLRGSLRGETASLPQRLRSAAVLCFRGAFLPRKCSNRALPGHPPPRELLSPKSGVRRVPSNSSDLSGIWRLGVDGLVIYDLKVLCVTGDLHLRSLVNRCRLSESILCVYCCNLVNSYYVETTKVCLCR